MDPKSIQNQLKIAPGAPRDLQEQPISLNLSISSKQVAKVVEKWTPSGPQNWPKIEPGAQNAVPKARQVAIVHDFSSHHRFSACFDGFPMKNQRKN